MLSTPQLRDKNSMATPIFLMVSFRTRAPRPRAGMSGLETKVSAAVRALAGTAGEDAYRYYRTSEPIRAIT